jgi:HAD superfamily hydrolase (TIGR01549 family)
MMALPQAVIFDVEGTLIDCVALILQCWHQTLAKHGFNIAVEELHRYSGMDAKLMLAALLPQADKALIRTLIDEQGERYREKFLPQAKAFPDARELFAALAKDGHRLALATTSQPDELRFYLKLLDITDYLTAAVTGDDVKREKPAPDLILKAAEQMLARTCAGTWVVGDTPYDAEAALAAGATPVGTAGGGFRAEELQRAGCVAVAGNFEGAAAPLARAVRRGPRGCSAEKLTRPNLYPLRLESVFESNYGTAWQDEREALTCLCTAAGCRHGSPIACPSSGRSFARRSSIIMDATSSCGGWRIRSGFSRSAR